MKSIFGPCTITHNGVDIGKSSGGGSLDIVTSERVVETLDGPICSPIAKYGTGRLSMFLPQAGTIGASMIYNYGTNPDFASLVLTGDDFTITMPAAELLWPAGITFGANNLSLFELGFFFKPSGGNLITFS